MGTRDPLVQRPAPIFTAISPTKPMGSADGYEEKMASTTALAATTVTRSLLNFDVEGFEGSCFSLNNDVSTREGSLGTSCSSLSEAA